MSAALHIELSELAQRQVREADTWWRRNRSKAPNAIREELEKISALLSFHPAVGARAQDLALPGVRRIHIERIRYYGYYRVVGSPEYIEILAFWSSLRGGLPPV